VLTYIDVSECLLPKLVVSAHLHRLARLLPSKNRANVRPMRMILIRI